MTRRAPDDKGLTDRPRWLGPCDRPVDRAPRPRGSFAAEPSMGNLSVEIKLGVAVLAVFLVAAVAGATVSGTIFERGVEDAALSSLQSASDAFAAQERAEIEKLASTLDALLANDELRAAFVARDRERLLAVASPLFETMTQRDRVTPWYFIEPEPAKTVFLRVHRPELHGDRVERSTLQKAIESG